jgi:hypothetical protein
MELKSDAATQFRVIRPKSAARNKQRTSKNGTSGPPTLHGIRTTLPIVRRLERASNASFTWERGNALPAKSFNFP